MMKALKNTGKSIICLVLTGSLSISIVYAFDGLLGGGGLAQVSKDLKHLIPEKTETGSALAKVNNQSFDDQDSLLSTSAVHQNIADTHTDQKAKFFSRVLNFYS